MATSPSLLPPLVTVADDRLVAAARAGDDSAFESLYRRHSERVFGFVVGRVRDHARAEDVTQEVFVSALRGLRGSDRPIAFKPWIFEIARNACIDESRRRSRAREVSLRQVDELPADWGSLLSPALSPPSAVEGKQRLRDLTGAFGGLSDTQHRLLVMRELEGRTYQEIGEQTGMTLQMVESTLFRARRKLNEEYEELASGRRCAEILELIETATDPMLSRAGVRQRRRLSRHVAHCTPCRHAAVVAGLDESLLTSRRVTERIAALLPFPLWRLTASSDRGATAASAAEAASDAPHLLLAAGAAAVAIAAAGGGVVSGIAARSHPAHPARGSSSAGPRATRGSARADNPARAPSDFLLRTRSSSWTGDPSRLRRATSTVTTASGAVPGGAAGATPGATTSSAGAATPGVTPAPAGTAASGSGAAGSAGSTTGTGGRSPGSPISGTTRAAAGAPEADGAIVSGVTRAVGTTVSGVTAEAGPTAAGVSGAVAGAVTGATGAAGSAVAGVAGAAGSAVSGVTEAAGSTVSGVTEAAGSTVSGVTEAAGSTVSGVTEAAGSTVSGVTKAVGSAVTGVTGAAVSGAGAVTAGLASALSHLPGPVGAAAAVTTKAAGSTVAGVTTAAGSTVAGTTVAAGATVAGTTVAAGATVAGLTEAAGSTVAATTDAAGSALAATTETAGSTAAVATEAAGSTVAATTAATGSTVAGMTGAVRATATGVTGAARSVVSALTSGLPR